MQKSNANNNADIKTSIDNLQFRRTQSAATNAELLNGSFTFVQNRNALFITFFLRPKVDDFLRWKGMPGGVVYGRMMDLCCLYGPETTDSMDIEVKRG